MRFPILVMAVLLSAAPPAATRSSVDRAALVHIPVAFGAAWDKGDGEALGTLMAPEVDFVTVGATWLHGRRDFTLYHSRLLADRFRGSTMVPLETRVTFVSPGLAFVRWSWRIAGDRNFDGSARPPRVGLMSMLAQRRAGHWLVIASQNTNKIPGTPPESAGITAPIALPEQ